MNERLLILKAYVEASTYRVKALKSIGGGYKTPTFIAKDCGIRTNHISKVLKELKENQLAVCINEDAKKGRLYKLTPQGLQVMEMIQK